MLSMIGRVHYNAFKPFVVSDVEIVTLVLLTARLELRIKETFVARRCTSILKELATVPSSTPRMFYVG